MDDDKNTKCENNIFSFRIELFNFNFWFGKDVTKDKNGELNFLFCFDLYKPGRSFVRDEVSFALMVARKLSEIL